MDRAEFGRLASRAPRGAFLSAGPDLCESCLLQTFGQARFSHLKPRGTQMRLFDQVGHLVGPHLEDDAPDLLHGKVGSASALCGADNVGDGFAV